MLLLLTVLLMLAALVLMILGLVDDTLWYIYGCIARSVGALLLLLAFGRLSRRRAVRLAAASRQDAGHPPAGANSSASDLGVASQAPVPAAQVTPAQVAANHDPVESDAQPVDPYCLADSAQDFSMVAVGVDGGAVPTAPFDESDDWAVGDDWEDVLFPIADYDDLLVGEILPLLGELDPSEREEVRARELSGKRRASVLRRLEVLGGPTAPILAPPAPAVAAPPARKSAPCREGAPVRTVEATTISPAVRKASSPTPVAEQQIPSSVEERPLMGARRRALPPRYQLPRP